MQGGRGQAAALPTMVPPSGSDLISVGYRQYAFGVVATHDGRVFVYSTRNARAFTRIMFDKTVDKYKTREYNFGVERATERALNDFARDYGLEWREL